MNVDLLLTGGRPRGTGFHVVLVGLRYPTGPSLTSSVPVMSTTQCERTFPGLVPVLLCSYGVGKDVLGGGTDVPEQSIDLVSKRVSFNKGPEIVRGLLD